MLTRKLIDAALIGLALAVWSAPVPARAAVAASEHVGVVSAERDARLAFTVPGQVKAVLVKPGDRVEAGAALVELDDTVGLAQTEVHRLRAASTLSVDAAEKQWRLAQVEEGLVKEALAKGSAGQFEVDRATLKAQLSGIEFEKAKEDRREAELALKQAEALHALRTLRAPEAGVVEEVAVQPGEGAEPGRPVVRVVSAERFRVEVNPPTAETARLRVGGSATVRFEAAASSESEAETKPGWVEAPARISHIATVADARSQTRLVHLTMDNPGNLPAGVQVRVRFTLD